MQIVCEPRGARKRDRITVPLTLHNMDTAEVSTLGDHAEQQGRGHEHRTSRAGAEHDTPACGITECNVMGCVIMAVYNTYRVFDEQTTATPPEIIPWRVRQEQRFL